MHWFLEHERSQISQNTLLESMVINIEANFQWIFGTWEYLKHNADKWTDNLYALDHGGIYTYMTLPRVRQSLFINLSSPMSHSAYGQRFWFLYSHFVTCLQSASSLCFHFALFFGSDSRRIDQSSINSLCTRCTPEPWS